MVDPSLFSPPYDAALCAALAEAGHDVTLHSRAPRPLESDPRAACRVDDRFYRVSERMRRRRSFRRLAGPTKVVEHAIDLAKLTFEVRHHPPDVVHVQWLVVPFLDRVALARMRRCAPLVLTLHNTVPMHGNPRSRVQTVGWRPALDLAHHLIVHTSRARQAMLDAGFADDRVTVIPHGVLPSDGGAAPTARAVSEIVEILLFGRLRPYKGADLLLDALACLPAEALHRARVRIVGEPLMPVGPLRAQAEALGVASHVEWDLRAVPEREVAAVFERADIIVFPYRDIDASGVLMKALTHGKAIVATTVGGLGDVVVDRESGLLVPSDDVDALSRALARLIDDASLRGRLGAGAGRVASRLPTWNDIAQMTVAVYERAAEAQVTS